MPFSVNIIVPLKMISNQRVGHTNFRKMAWEAYAKEQMKKETVGWHSW